jgi:hypothetical protein
MARCQYCGKPVAASSGRPELPAWLETLRAGDQSTTSSTDGSGVSDLSPDDFADESQLPGWMQAGRNDTVDNNPSGAYQLRRPASTPAPNTDSAFLQTKGMSASSFIDEQFLPSWLQEKQVAMPNTPQENIAASSLVQQDALPDWIKAVPQQSTPPVTQPVTLYGQQNNQANMGTPARPPQGIAGNDLIDQQAVPQWMAGQNAGVPANGQNGFAASSLIDKDVLPPWMREQSENGREQRNGNANNLPPSQSAQPVYPTYPAQPSYGQPSSYQLPFGQAQAQPPQSPLSMQPAQQVSMNNQMQVPPPQQQPRPNEQPGALANQSLSASSFIDVNSLPDWLRSSGDVRPGATPSSSPMPQGGVDSSRQGNFGIPPRPYPGRVPSRPRNEPGSHEESAIAANAFASMLGVASATPFFPGQQSRDGAQGQGQSQMPAQAQPPQNMPVAPMGYGVGMPGAPGANNSPMWQQGAMNVVPTTPDAGQMGQQPQQPGQGFAPVAPVPSATGYQNGYAMNGMNSMPGMQQEIPSSNNAGQTKTQGKSAKRGFLSTILDWFSR